MYIQMHSYICVSRGTDIHSLLVLFFTCCNVYTYVHTYVHIRIPWVVLCITVQESFALYHWRVCKHSLCTIPLACVQTFTLHYTTGVCANIHFALYHWRVCKHSVCTIPLACVQTFTLTVQTVVCTNTHCTHLRTCCHWICYLYKQMHLHVALSFDLYLQYDYVMYVCVTCCQ